MKLTQAELDFLSLWAREEWEPACYQLPAHRLQLAHGATSAQLILFIKAWTQNEGRKDQEILDVGRKEQAAWPWQTNEDFTVRLADLSRLRNHSSAPTTPATLKT
jgi:hypothetical protein